MPKRRRTAKYPSPDVQGDGSWVVVTQLTVAQMRDTMKASKAEDVDNFELGVDLIKEHTIFWNWVDDDDEEFPQPKDDPSVIEELCDFEVEFLSECIKGKKSTAKN